jgi:hypothetical protein
MMEVLFRFRQGLGFDAEYTEDIVHIMVDDKDDEYVVAFNGGIIKLPFCQIYFGDFGELGTLRKTQ